MLNFVFISDIEKKKKKDKANTYRITALFYFYRDVVFLQ